MRVEQSFDLYDEEFEVDDHGGHEAEPNYDVVESGVCTVSFEVVQDQLFYASCFAQVLHQQIGSV